MFREGILPARKTPHIHVRRPAGLIRRLRRFGGAPKVKFKVKSKDNSPRSVGAASAAPTRLRVRVSLGRRNVQSRAVKTATSSPCSALRRRSRGPCHHSSFPEPDRNSVV